MPWIKLYLSAEPRARRAVAMKLPSRAVSMHATPVLLEGACGVALGPPNVQRAVFTRAAKSGRRLTAARRGRYEPLFQERALALAARVGLPPVSALSIVIFPHWLCFQTA